MATKTKIFSNGVLMSSGGPVEAGIIKTVLEWAWAIVGVLMGIIWKKHNEEMTEIRAGIKKLDGKIDARADELDAKIDAVEKSAVPMAVYEQNRKEVRDVQIKMFERLDTIGQSLARIEGKLDK